MVIAIILGCNKCYIDLFKWFTSFPSSYYQLEETSAGSVNAFLSSVVSDAITRLIDAGCVETDNEDAGLPLYSTSNGRLASFYYLSHKTVELFLRELKSNASMEDLINVLSVSLLNNVKHSHTQR